jgi:outer membrane protein assembly factor BamB
MNWRGHKLREVRLATLVFPPFGLTLLWLSRQIKAGRKLFGTLWTLLYSLIYAGLIIALLMFFTGLEIEWRGGYPPTFTYHKTKPNYDAVEKNRAAQAASPPRTSSAPRPSDSARPYWTDFRGPNRDGHYDEQPILDRWPGSGLKLLWRQPIGGGYASFTVAQGNAFTIEQRRDDEAIVAYDIATGREAWVHRYPAHFEESMGGDGPRATPTWNEGRIFSLGAMGDLICLDAADGKVIWKLDLVTENQTTNLYYGMAGSPLIVDDKVIVQPGAGRNNAIVAYKKTTGAPVWKSVDDPGAYSSPMLVELAGQRQLLVVTAQRALGLRIEDGKMLWSFPWIVQMNNRNVAQPVALGPNRFLLSAGYGTGCAAIQIDRVGTGFSAREVWRNKNLKNKFTSSVFSNGYVYGLDEDILTCLDAASGERKWKDGRYGYGQLLVAGDFLVVLTSEGQLALVRATPERHEELARFQAIQGKTWNYPALAHGKIFVRNAAEMACYEIAPLH